jgi:hypothetical protein
MNKHKKKVEYDVHHIWVNVSRWGSNDPVNLVTMKRKEHEAYHVLFSNEWFKEALIKLFLLGEKTLKDWPLKKELRYCLQNIDYKPQCFKS